MLKIGLDFINLRSLQDGMGRFTQQFLKGLANFDSKNEYFLFFYHDMIDKIQIDFPQFNKIPVKIHFSDYLPRNQIYLSLIKTNLPHVDLIHSPVSLPPTFFFKRTKVIATVHDLAFKYFPETCKNKSLWWWNIAWPRCLKRADHLVTVSKNTKRDLIRIYNISNERMSVVYNSINYLFREFSKKSLNSIKSKYKLPEKFILHVGAPHKRKNITNLIKAFKLITKKHQFPHKLVLAGPKGWDYNNLLNSVKYEGLLNKTIFTGFMPNKDLPLLYKAADVFVFPSLYEGFGYPPLEAMACGTPVVASNTSSLKEVVSGAGLLVDPLNYKEIAEAVMKIISSPVLSKQLRKKGLQRVKMFSLERKIKSYLDVYKKVAAS